MTFGSLFAGIGGFDLGLERAGMTCKWQCEIDPYARRVLGRHWPDVRRWDDVRTFPPPDGDWGVDLICGGFPCQDISTGGTRRGIRAERSGLFFQIARIARHLRPRYLLMENVTALLHQPEWMGAVLGELAEGGFDAEWDCIPAAAVGADHIRDRIFILAYPPGHRGRVLEHPPYRRGSPGWPAGDFWEKERQEGIGSLERRRDDSIRRAALCGVRPMADGVPERLDDFRGYGNAVVPDVAEWIGRRILEADGVTP